MVGVLVYETHLVDFPQISQTVVGHIFTHFHSGTHFHGGVAVTFQKQWRPTALIAADSLSKRHNEPINAMYNCIVQQQINLIETNCSGTDQTYFLGDTCIKGSSGGSSMPNPC